MLASKFKYYQEGYKIPSCDINEIYNCNDKTGKA